MSISGQSGMGRIRLVFDAGGPEFPVANAVAYGTSPTHAILGDFALKGDLAETDTGAVSISKANGFIRIGGNNEDGKGAALCSEIIFSPALNGTIVVEARLELQALTTRNVFVGLCGTIADDVAEPLTATGTALTLTATDLCGFLLDSQLTDADQWHMPYNGGTTTGKTISTDVDSSQAAVAGECDILRLEVDPNGTARWFINGKLEATVANAVSTTALQGVVCGCWGTTTTAADIDLDFLVAEANRDWTR